MLKLLYILYYIAISYGFPTEIIFPELPPNPISSTNSGLTLPLIKKQFPNNKPTGIVKTVFRSNTQSIPFINPINPMENLMLYLLLSAGRDFMTDSEMQLRKEHNHRRSGSPDLFSDPFGDFSSGTGTIINGTNKNTLTRGSRDYAENRLLSRPIQEGSCMCFNTFVRSRVNRRFDPLVLPRKSKVVEGWKSSTSDKSSSISDKSSSTEEVTVMGGNSSGGPSVRVLRVADLDVGNSSVSSEGGGGEEEAKGSTGSKGARSLDEMFLDLRPMDAEDERRRFNDTGTQKESPPWFHNIRPKPRQSKNLTDKPEDDGYYFLSYSGGTENRTTAEIEPIQRFPDYNNNNNDKQPSNEEERQQPNDVVRLSEFLERLVNPRVRRHRRADDDDVGAAEFRDPGNATGEPANATEPPDDDEGVPEEVPGGAGSKKSSSGYLYTVTIPTAACLMLIIVGLCFLARPTGNCCDRFLRNPGQPTGAERRARAQLERLAAEKRAAAAASRDHPPAARLDQDGGPRRVVVLEPSSPTAPPPKVVITPPTPTVAVASGAPRWKKSSKADDRDGLGTAWRRKRKETTATAKVGKRRKKLLTLRRKVKGEAARRGVSSSGDAGLDIASDGGL